MHIIHANILAGSSKAKEGYNSDSHLTLPYLHSYLPVVPPPGRVSRQPRRLRSGPRPCEPFRIAGAVTLQPYASRLVIIPVSRGVSCLHALISHGVMTPAAPSRQDRPHWLVCACPHPSLPSTPRPPSMVWYRYRRNLSGAI